MRARRRDRYMPVLITLVILGMLTGGALAQSPSAPINLTDPGDTQLDTPAGKQPLDTAATPSAKEDPTIFQRLAGAGFPDQPPPDGAPDTLTTNFFTIRFLSGGADGYAAGAACENDAATMADLDTDSPDHCLRVPVIWRYHKDDDGTDTWTRVYKGDDHGFVGGIAYANPDGTDVLAVGGTGSYPRTEMARKTGESDADYLARDLTDGAGRARVWRYAPDFYGDEDFHEVSDLPSASDGTPMRGLTALDCSQNTSGILVHECFVGGLKQIWEWKDGDFQTTDISAQLSNPGNFRYRVRQISFMPNDGGGNNPDVVATTAGCCGQSPATDEGSILTLDGSTLKWDAEPLSYWTGRSGPVNISGVHPGGHAPRDTLPDSLWAFALMPEQGGQFGPGASFLLSAGSDGATAADAPPSELVGGVSLGTQTGHTGYTTTGDPTGSFLNAAVNPSVSSVRLVSGDGDFAGPPELTTLDAPAGQLVGTPDVGEAKSQAAPSKTLGPPDKLMDWAVGQLRATGQGVAYTTLTNGNAVADTVVCPGNPLVPAASAPTDAVTLALQCKAGGNTDQVERDLRSTRLFKLPVYGLNAFQYAPNTQTAWAVGDRGAILRLGGDSATTGPRDPQAPVLGAPASSLLPDGSAYDAFRPLSAESLTGIVPPLAARPEQTTAHPQVVPDGTPDTGGSPDLPDNTVDQIAMSRDGQEGWAVGSGYEYEGDRPNLVLDHYNGWNWTRCDPDGVPRQLPADQACASLAPLETYFLGSKSHPVSLGAIARVPLENDDDASNDDDFEAVAFGDLYQPKDADKARMVVLRYRSGVWSVDDQWMQELDLEDSATVTYPKQLVMTSPTEGWLVADFGGSGSKVFQLHEGHWTACTPTNCDGLYSHVSTETAKQRFHLAVAGSRVYLTGFATDSSSAGGATNVASQTYPVILHIDPGDDQWQRDFGCAANPCTPGESLSGQISGIVVQKTGDGYTGWAAGKFGGGTVAAATAVRETEDETAGRTLASDETPLLQLSGSEWKPVAGGTAVEQQLLSHQNREDPALLSLNLPGGPSTLIAPGISPNPSANSSTLSAPHGSLLGLSSGGWGIVPTPFLLVPGTTPGQAAMRAVAPDNQGGFWAAVHQPDRTNFDHTGETLQNGTYFYHYTNRVHEPVFSEIGHPIQRSLTATAGGADGSFWVATNSNQLYRYDRLTGWGEVKLKAWDPGLVTNPSAIYALAVGADGTGLAVGKGGRIADLSPVRAILDVASGKRCSDADTQPPCSTGHDLRAAAVGPGGAALVGGTDRALLYRGSSDGAFQAVTPPPTAPTATITGISFPTAGQAFITTSTGQVYEGPPSGGAWVREAVDSAHRDLSLDSRGITQSLNAISIGADGVGFAVGDRGVIIQRDADGTWHRLRAPLLAKLTSVALPANGQGAGALIGGSDGLVLTLVDGKFEIARPPDFWDPAVNDYGEVVSAHTVGVALLPGGKDGDVEAFAATQAGGDAGRQPSPPVILHYSSDPNDPLLSPEGRVQPLPDTPAHVDGEVSFAAFGKSDCQAAPCQAMSGSNVFNERVAGAVADDIAAAGKRPGGTQFAIFTGDVDEAAGRPDDGEHAVRENTLLDANVVHANWLHLIASRIQESGLPLFGAVGVQDLEPVRACPSSCTGTTGTAGTSTIWQAAMAGMPEPWGDAPAASHDGLSFVPVGGDPTRDGKAQTHYAFEVKRGDQALALVAVVDSSMKSLTATDATQNPVEDQLTWLDDVLGNRQAGLPAIVVTEDPTYSYGPGALSDTASDATQLETILLRDHVNLVVSGRLGYNGLYWATAPGLHYPCAGSNYPDPYKDAPAPGSAPNCGGDSQAGATDTATTAAGSLVGTLQGLNAPVPVPSQVTHVTGDEGVTGSLPFVIAATAGGTYGPQGHDSGGTAAGFWHGYTTIRLIPGMQPVVEQRPVLDWVGVTGATHVLAPGQHMQLHGYGREPLGYDTGTKTVDINSPAVTHRYDLIEADPESPWLPNVDPASPFPHHYVPLDSSVATIDQQTGAVTTGRGSHPRVYALAVLSIGKKAASWPLDLEPRRSFHQRRALTIAAPTIPAIRVLGLGAASLNPPSASPPSTPPPPVAASLQLPSPPALPTFPSATPATAPPPAPPAPPPPPSQQNALPLNLTVNPVGVAVPPATGVTAQPTPPVNPAPPSGARREAKQRQAATAKSEEGGGEQAGEAHGRIDAVDSPNASATRLDPRRPEPHAFTAIVHHEQASAWTTELEWGGGITLMALALALGFITARPTPRRRTPELPAPAYARKNR